MDTVSVKDPATRNHTCILKSSGVLIRFHRLVLQSAREFLFRSLQICVLVALSSVYANFCCKKLTELWWVALQIEHYAEALAILLQILGPENTEETGMFSNFYWLMPVGKFIEIYGLDHFSLSIKAIEKVTKRNTGEYAIRPYARQYPNKH
jgi:hypothetical protein